MSCSMRSWCDGSGRINLDIKSEDLSRGYHQGQCEDSVRDLMEEDYIREQFDAISDEDALKCVKEYGIEDPDEPKMYLLWLACGDLIDEEE